MSFRLTSIPTLGIMSQAGGHQASSEDWQPLNIKDHQHWSFVGGPWQENDEGIVTPPEAREDEYLAFDVGKAYADVEAEFEFRADIPHSGAGLVVRAQDPSHYYLVHFPCCGQHYRAKHFWAAISKADGSGWLQILKMEMLHGVPSETEVWHKARIVVQGNEIRLWVDGRPFPVFRDDDYKEGYVGLEAWTYYAGPSSSFRNLKIRGQEVSKKPWNEALQQPKNWFHPYLMGGGQHSTAGLVRTSDGALLMNISNKQLVRSTDNGRTWSPVEAQGWSGGYILARQDGRVLSFKSSEEEGTTLSVSEDNGKTWSAPEKVVQEPFEPDRPMKLASPEGFIELQDGTLLAFHTARDASWDLTKNHQIREWGGMHFATWSSRSTDGGYTWSSPVTLDGPPGVGINFDLVEFSSTMQTRAGKILCLGRPVYSPWMWETWSENNGESWGPTTRGPFPSYACATPGHATASGALLVGGRMPGLGLHVSHDDGMTWKSYRIGTDIWAMGDMYEVEPDLVLWVYMDSWHSDLRAQFIRITPDGLEPVREMLPT